MWSESKYEYLRAAEKEMMPTVRIKNLFEVCRIFEDYYEKDVYYLSDTIIQDIIMSSCLSNKTLATQTATLLMDYFRWYEDNHDGANITHNLIINQDLANKMIAPYYNEEEIPTEDEFNEIVIKKIEFVIDQAILLCWYSGIVGVSNSELLQITQDNITENGVKIVRDGITVEINIGKEIKNYIEAGCALTTFEGERYVNDGFLIKTPAGKRGRIPSAEQVDVKKKTLWLKGREIQIRKHLGTGYSATKVRSYGFINTCKKEMERQGIPALKEFLNTNEGKEILCQYNIPQKNVTRIIKQFKDKIEK